MFENNLLQKDFDLKVIKAIKVLQGLILLIFQNYGSSLFIVFEFIAKLPTFKILKVKVLQFKYFKILLL